MRSGLVFLVSMGLVWGVGDRGEGGIGMLFLVLCMHFGICIVYEV